MKDLNVEELVNINYRILLLLGIATSFIMDFKKLAEYHERSEDCDWFMKAVQAVVYEQKPLPEIPW